MIQRPIITQKVIKQLSGGSFIKGQKRNNRRKLNYARRLHHGLSQFPMNSMYPFLGLEEVVVFAEHLRHLKEAESPERRNTRLPSLKRFLESNPAIHDIFSFVYRKGGYEEMESNLKISDSDSDEKPIRYNIKYQQWNPQRYRDHPKRNLKERLEMVDDEKSKDFLEKVRELPIRFEVHYPHHDKEPENPEITLIKFRQAYPNEKELFEGYVRMVAEMINKFPQRYEPYTPDSDQRIEQPKPQQQPLFPSERNTRRFDAQRR